MARFHFRSFVSLLVTITFLLAVTTGLILWLSHNPQTFGIGKGVWKNAHIFVSLTMTVAGVCHLVLNWRVLWSYVWQKTQRQFNRKWELAAAVLLTAVVVAISSAGGSNGPPMERLVEMNLQQISEMTRQPVDKLVADLKKEGIEVQNQAASLKEIAEQNKIKIEQVYRVVQRQFQQGGKPGNGR